MSGMISNNKDNVVNVGIRDNIEVCNLDLQKKVNLSKTKAILEFNAANFDDQSFKMGQLEELYMPRYTDNGIVDNSEYLNTQVQEKIAQAVERISSLKIMLDHVSDLSSGKEVINNDTNVAKSPTGSESPYNVMAAIMALILEILKLILSSSRDPKLLQALNGINLKDWEFFLINIQTKLKQQFASIDDGLVSQQQKNQADMLEIISTAITLAAQAVSTISASKLHTATENKHKTDQLTNHSKEFDAFNLADPQIDARLNTKVNMNAIDAKSLKDCVNNADNMFGDKDALNKTGNAKIYWDELKKLKGEYVNKDGTPMCLPDGYVLKNDPLVTQGDDAKAANIARNAKIDALSKLSIKDIDVALSKYNNININPITGLPNSNADPEIIKSFARTKYIIEQKQLAVNPFTTRINELTSRQATMEYEVAKWTLYGGNTNGGGLANFLAGAISLGVKFPANTLNNLSAVTKAGSDREQVVADAFGQQFMKLSQGMQDAVRAFLEIFKNLLQMIEEVIRNCTTALSTMSR